jgi:hypothetical protein
MPAVIHNLVRTGMIAGAIVLVLIAGLGIHVHGHHAGDHHHGVAHHDHDHDDGLIDHDDPAGGDAGGDDGLFFHAHGGMTIATVPTVTAVDLLSASLNPVRHRTFDRHAPDNPARDIDPPPNKRVL